MKKLIFVIALFFLPLICNAYTPQNGDLVKCPEFTSVYLVNGGFRYSFPFSKVYESYYGNDFSIVKTISLTELGSLQLKGNVRLPNNSLIKLTTDPKVYKVVNGQLVWIESETAAIAEFGAGWANKVIDVPDVFFGDYQMSSSGITPDTAGNTSSCNSDIYSCNDWGSCSINGIQTRSCTISFDCPNIITPSPITQQTCSYNESQNCTEDTWSCGDWGSCSANGIQTRSCSITFDCSSVNTSSPITQQNCSYNAPICTEWGYSDWSACNNSVQTRTVIYRSPNGCEGGSPLLSQSCTMPVVSNWSDFNLRYTKTCGATSCSVEFPVVSRDIKVKKAVFTLSKPFSGITGAEDTTIKIFTTIPNWYTERQLSPQKINDTTYAFDSSVFTGGAGNDPQWLSKVEYTTFGMIPMVDTGDLTIDTDLSQWVIWDLTVNKQINIQ